MMPKKCTNHPDEPAKPDATQECYSREFKLETLQLLSSGKTMVPVHQPLTTNH